MARKKIVFVIVEGPSDDEALGVILHRLFDKNAVHVEITHGDITSERLVNSGNISSKIGDMVRGYAKANHYKAADFQEVIHLIDTDGAFIEDKYVVEDADFPKPHYTITEIRTAYPERLIARNKKKSENVNRICNMSKTWNTVPYRAYYLSSNLDHVLYDKLNSTDEEKERDAYAFVRKYKDCLDDFLMYISDSDFAVCGEYKESWEYIKTDRHSLERHTNLGICLKKIRETRKSIETEQNLIP